jgi:flagellar assembly protein FliH
MADESKVGLKGILKGHNSGSFQPATQGQFPNLNATGAPSKVEFDKMKAEVQKIQSQNQALLLQIQKEQKISLERIEAARIEGHTEGQKEGYENGKNAALTEYQQNLETLQGEFERLFMSIGAEHMSVLGDLQESIEKVVMILCRKICGEITEKYSDVVAKSVRMAFAELGTESKLVLRLNPEDVDWIEAQIHSLKPENLNNQASLAILADESLERGGCVLETEAGTIDANIKRLWNSIEKAISENLRAWNEEQKQEGLEA